MENARIIIFISIVFLLCFNSVYSQDPERKTYKNAVTFNVLRLALLEARFGYERKLSERHLVRTTLGIQFPVSSESFGNISSFPVIPYYYKVSKGIYLAMGYNYVIIPRKGFYISSEIYFNYNSYDEKYYTMLVGMDMDSYVSLQSMDLTKTGIKFLMGRKLTMHPSKETRMQFDFFWGAGIQYRQENITIYKKLVGTTNIDNLSEIPYFDPPQTEASNKFYPTLHGGILLSFPF
jgi:hypothetical protein